MRLSFASFVMFIAVTAALAAAADVHPASTEPFFFRVSPIEATAERAVGATRYGVTVTNAPVGNAPFIRWYLDLKPGSTNAHCSNDVLPGGTKTGPGRYVWKNQGVSFMWYHGPAGSYASRRSYGCDPAKLGRNGYPGTVTVVFENDSETCTASFIGSATSVKPQDGPAAVCQAGDTSHSRVQYVFLAVGAGVSVAYAVSAILARRDGARADVPGRPARSDHRRLPARSGRDGRHDDHAVGSGIHPVLLRRQAARARALARFALRRRPRGDPDKLDRGVHRDRGRRDAVGAWRAQHTGCAAAAKALGPLAGHAAETVFALGLLGAAFLGLGVVPLTSSYATTEALGLERGLDLRPRQAPAFNGLLAFFLGVAALLVLIPGLPLIRVMFLAQVVNGLLLPVILVFVMLLNRRRKGSSANSPAGRSSRPPDGSSPRSSAPCRSPSSSPTSCRDRHRPAILHLSLVIERRAIRRRRPQARAGRRPGRSARARTSTRR